MTLSSPQQPLLEARNLTKLFPRACALSRVNLALRRGEILAVIGENGAGKSTLMRILAGVIPADSGEILIEGRPVAIDNIQTAHRLGIVLLHQELAGRGMALLFVSSDMEEVLGMADRVLVMHDGRIIGAVILAGAVVDELIKRFAARRRAARQAAQAAATLP